MATRPIEFTPRLTEAPRISDNGLLSALYNAATPAKAAPVAVRTPMQQQAADQTNYYLESGAQTAPPIAYSTNSTPLDMALQRGAQLQLGARDGREAVRQLMEEQVRRGERPASDLPQGSAVVSDTPAFNPNGVNIIGGKRFAFRNGIPVGGEGLNVTTVPTTPRVAEGGFTPAEAAGLNMGVNNALRMAATQPAFVPPVAPQALMMPVDKSPQGMTSVTPATQAGASLIPTPSQVNAALSQRGKAPISLMDATRAVAGNSAVQEVPETERGIQRVQRAEAQKEIDTLQKEKERLQRIAGVMKDTLSSGKKKSTVSYEGGDTQTYEEDIPSEELKKLKQQYEEAMKAVTDVEGKIKSLKK